MLNMKIVKLTALIAAVGVFGTFASHSNAAVRFKVVQGSSCAAAEAVIPITTTGGTVSASVCVVATASEFVCSATYPIVATAAPATTAGVAIASRTVDAALPNVLDVTALPQTITASNTNVQLGNGVALAGTQTGASGANVKIADITLTIPAGLPASTSYAFAVDAGGQIEVRNGASVNCNDLANDRVSNGPGVQSFSLATPAAPTPTAPTASLGAAPTLTGGAGTQPVTVLTPGSLTGQLALSCSVGASSTAAAAITISSGATQTILAGATTATPIGLTCTPQAAAATATLTCTQTPTPAAVLPNLTSTITCPAVVAGVVAYTATPTPLSFTGVTAGTPTANQVVTVAATAGNAAAVNLSACAFGGANAADFSFNPAPSFPVAIAAGGNTTIPVRFTPALANSAARTATLTCQVPNATVAGATSFVITLNGTNPAATPIIVAATTPPGAVTLPGYQPGVAGPGTSSTTLAFSATGGAAALTCTAGGAGYTATPSPLNLAAGATGSVTVTYTGTVAGTFPGTLNCTSTAPATGGPFAYTLSTNVTAFVPPVATVTVPTMGAFGLGLMGLLVAGFGALVQRRRIG
jgi:hypothetical protein